MSDVVHPPSLRVRERVSALLDRICTVDARALALLRIGTASLVIADLVARLPGVPLFLTDGGWYPRAAVRTAELRPHLYEITGSTAGVLALMLVHAVIAALLLLGVKPRLTALACLAMSASLHVRNPYVLTGGDTVLRLLLFHCIFLPTHLRYTWSRWRASPPDAPTTISTRMLLPFLGQLCIVYFLAGLSKLVNSPQWRDGLGACGALHSEEYTTWLGRMFQGWCGPPVDIAVFVIELLLVFLVFVPQVHVKTRLFVIAVFAAMHAGFLVLLGIVLFSVASMGWWFPLLPASVWDRVEKIGLLPRPRGVQGPRRIDTPWPLVIASALAFAGVVLWNVSRFEQTDLPRPPLVAALGLDQGWHLFARSGWRTGFIVAPGLRADGVVVDVAKGDLPLSFERPAHLGARFSSERERMFMRALVEDRPPSLAETVARAMCARDESLLGVRVYAVRQPMRPDLRGLRPLLSPVKTADLACRPGDRPVWPASATPPRTLGLNGLPPRTRDVGTGPQGPTREGARARSVDAGAAPGDGATSPKTP